MKQTSKLESGDFHTIILLTAFRKRLSVQRGKEVRFEEPKRGGSRTDRIVQTGPGEGFEPWFFQSFSCLQEWEFFWGRGIGQEVMRFSIWGVLPEAVIPNRKVNVADLQGLLPHLGASSVWDYSPHNP